MWGMTFAHCILRITKDNGASVLAGNDIPKGQFRVCVSISSVILSSAYNQQRAWVVIVVYTVYTVVYVCYIFFFVQALSLQSMAVNL